MSSSSISSNVTSSDQDTENGSVTFETVGEWDPNRAQGPAVVVPRDIKNIVLTKYRIEWLDVSSRDENYYAKNHIVASVTFAEYFRINSTSYSSARISMELGKIWEVDSNSVDSSYRPGDHYYPGIYMVVLQQFEGHSRSSTHNLTYSLEEGTTLGTLINEIIDEHMHHFLFLPYTIDSRWKGCGDHALHCWAVFVRKGYITSAQPQEKPDAILANELTYTYLPSGASTYEPVGRGWWLRWNPIQDDYTPELVFSPRVLTHQLPEDRGS